MLQHASINTFVRHYSVGIHVDTQAIVQGLPAQKQLMRFAASMSRSIDPRQPYKLEHSSRVNDLPRVQMLQGHVHGRKQLRDEKKRSYEATERDFQQTFGDDKFEKSEKKLPRRACRENKGVKGCKKDYMRADQRYQRALRELRNEKQRQRNCLI